MVIFRSYSMGLGSMMSNEDMIEALLEASLLKNSSLPKSNLKWQRKPFTRKQLNDLCKLSNSMNEEEINKRIKATTFPGKPGPEFID